MKRTVLQKPAIACFLGDQQEPSYRGSPKDQAEEALETVRKLGGHASFIQTLTLLRDNVVVSYLEEEIFFLSVTMKSSTANSAADWYQPQGICLYSVNPEGFSMALGLKEEPKQALS